MGAENRTVLVTGGAGFIGSNFIRLMRRLHPEDFILNVDVLTYAGNPENLQEFASDPMYRFLRTDIRDRRAIEEIFDRYPIDTVVNFAAESHVDRSITDPEIFLSTNVIGTQVLLDAARAHWSLDPGNKHCRDYRPGVRYLQVSTDEVYGSLGATGAFEETTPLSPNSPYSASKASADLLVRAYAATYGLPVNITRCSNNYGPYQFPEKLIPLMIHKCVSNQPLPIYGDGKQIRDWLHVTDHCRAIDAVLSRGRVGEVYNIGGNQEKTNLEIVHLILEATGKDESLIRHVQDRPGHDRRYAMNNHKITTELGWAPSYTFEEGIRETINWYLQHPEWVEHIVSGVYQKDYSDLKGSEQQ